MMRLTNWEVDNAPETRADGELSDAEAEEISGGVHIY